MHDKYSNELAENLGNESKLYFNLKKSSKTS